MNADEIKIGGCYAHRLHGNCTVVLRKRNGFWIEVWGGPSGDKKYTFKGIDPKDISERKK